MLRTVLNGLKIIAFLIASFLFVHVFAVLGVFVAFSYPIWWIFAPNMLVCLVCRLKGTGEYCSICKKHIAEDHMRYPKTLFSVIVNSLLILIITVLCALLVFIEYRTFVSLGYIPASEKTVTFKIPDRGLFIKTGEIFPMKIEISGVKKAVNVVQADIGFDSDKVEVVDISVKNSFATIFLQKEINNDIGYVRLSGGLPNPGFREESGEFGTIYFKAKVAGLTEMQYLPTSLVLANDGRGTNIIKSYPKMSYIVLPEKVTYEEEQLQKKLLEEDVLGTNTYNDDQLVFFETTRNVDVLGVSDRLENQSSGDSLMNTLASIDSYLLSIIESILSFVGIKVSLN